MAAWSERMEDRLDDLSDEERREVLQVLLDGATIDKDNNLNLTLAVPTEEFVPIDKLVSHLSAQPKAGSDKMLQISEKPASIRYQCPFLPAPWAPVPTLARKRSTSDPFLTQTGAISLPQIEVPSYEVEQNGTVWNRFRRKTLQEADRGESALALTVSPACRYTRRQAHLY